jgi:hypothetical protein
MENEDIDNQVVTMADLATILRQYHGALARLGSGVISVASGLRMSENPGVVKEADDAYEKLDEFIAFMEGAANALQEIVLKNQVPNGK